MYFWFNIVEFTLVCEGAYPQFTLTGLLMEAEQGWVQGAVFWSYEQSSGFGA